jgi:type 1 glutamine amidotransferase
MRILLCLVMAIATAGTVGAEDARKRVLLVTHAGGYMHDSLLVAEQVLAKLGPTEGFEFTCYRFTADPDAKTIVKRKVDGAEKEMEITTLEAYSARFQKTMGEPVTRKQCGRVNADTLKRFDVVVFFTTSGWSRPDEAQRRWNAATARDPLTEEELRALIAWVNDGGAFVGVHCASDTLHNTKYGDLVGGTFGGHPWVQNVRLRAEDPKHPAAKGLTEGSKIFDEIYQFSKTADHPKAVPLKIQPYSRERLHIILSVDNSSIDVTKGAREDQDYPVAWCQKVGKGRSFYTSLGHHKEVWLDPRFQQHLIGGIKWAVGKLDGDATPSGRRK